MYYYLKGIISTTVVRNLVAPLQNNLHDPKDSDPRRGHSPHCSPSSLSLTHCHHLTQARPIWSHLPSLCPYFVPRLTRNSISHSILTQPKNFLYLISEHLRFMVHRFMTRPKPTEVCKHVSINKTSKIISPLESDMINENN